VLGHSCLSLYPPYGCSDDHRCSHALWRGSTTAFGPTRNDVGRLEESRRWSPTGSIGVSSLSTLLLRRRYRDGCGDGHTRDGHRQALRRGRWTGGWGSGGSGTRSRTQRCQPPMVNTAPMRRRGGMTNTSAAMISAPTGATPHLRFRATDMIAYTTSDAPTPATMADSYP